MADSREFLLIGNFTDNITPALEKINGSLAQTKRAFESFGSKRGGIENLTKTFGKVIGAHKILTTEVGNLRSEMQNSFLTIKEYNKLMGKAIGANIMMRQTTAQTFGQQARDIANATTQLRQFGTLSRNLRRSTGGGGGGGGTIRRPPGPPGPPGAPRTPRTPRTPRMSGGGGGGGGGGGSRYYDESRDAGLAFGTTLGYSLSNVIVGGVTKGFEIGVSLMRKPFDYFVQGLGERIQDELSDLKAAGGYYGIAKRQKDPFVKTFDQALEFTQQNNKVMAKLAAALPGSTQDYIEVSKRIGDTVARTVATDKGAAIKYAETLRMEQPNIYGKKALEGTGTDASQRAIQVMLGELTKKTVLAGQGGRAGAGGAKGPYGLPGLSERILSQESVSVAQFQRYSAIFSDPAILDALQRYVPQLNKTAKNSVDRFKTIMKFYDDVLPPELIEKYRRSIAGLQESFNTAILGPETGLFGLGRKMDGLGYKMNDFGQYVDKFGNATEDATKFIKAELSVFDMLRDIVANTSVVLMPIIENITLLYDPLKKIGFTLKDARHYTAQFLQSFNYYKNGLTAFAKGLPKDDMAAIMGTRDLRATFAAVANLFKQFGVFNSREFEKMMTSVLDPDANMGAVLKSLIDSFLNSDVAKKIGEFLGVLVGTVLSEVANFVGVIAGVVEGGPLASGFTKGFQDAGGPKAIQSIFENVFKALWKAFTWVFSQAPLQFTILGAVTTLIPALTAGLGVVITGFIQSLFDKLPKLIKGKLAADKVTKAVSKASLRDARTVSEAGSDFRQTSAKNTRSAAPKSASFRAMPRTVPKNPQFPNVAIPGRVQPGVGGVTGPFTPPKSLFKGPVDAAAKAAAAKEAKHLAQLKQLRANDAINFKNNPLGKIFGKLGKFGTSAKTGMRSATGATGAGYAADAGARLKQVTSVDGALKGLATNAGKVSFGLGALFAVVEGAMKFFETGDIFEGLGAGAGPVLGAAIGFALLGPLGAFIGQFVGSMTEVTDPLANAFRSLWSTITTVGEILGQVGGDILGMLNGLIQLIPGVSKGFNILRFAMFALLSPFKLLEIGILGIYELYLGIKKKFLGLNPEEQKRLDERRSQRATDEFTIQGREASGYSLKTQELEEYKKFKDAQLRGDKDAMNRSAMYMQSIKKLQKTDYENKADYAKKPAKVPPALTSTELAKALSAFTPAAPVAPTKAPSAFTVPAKAPSAFTVPAKVPPAPAPAKVPSAFTVPTKAPPAFTAPVKVPPAFTAPAKVPPAPAPVKAPSAITSTELAKALSAFTPAAPVTPAKAPSAFTAPAKVPPAPAPAKVPPAFTVPTKAPAPVPLEVKATASSTAALNQKATSQITHASSISKNTTTANTHLVSIRLGLVAISNKLSSIQTALLPAKVPAAITPAKIPSAITPSRLAAIPQEVKTTASSTAALNQKATTQVAHLEAVSKNTTTANTHLVSIRLGLVAISNKLSSIQTALLGDLNSMRAGITSISSLLQSGNTRVKTTINIPGGPPNPAKPTANTNTKPVITKFSGEPGKINSSLSGAISSEMKNKPSGSDLVIANSSETVIPAAGGLNNGIDGLMEAVRTSGQSVARSMQTGLNVLTQTIIRSSEQTTNAVKQSGASTTAAISQASARSAQQNAALMAAVKAGGVGGGGLGGGALGGGAGGAAVFGASAARFGLQMTSGYRPGDPGYHGMDRARDYSNGTGPTPQMMQFAQFLASSYGSNLKELIYTPLGFSIKNGQRVAPYAQSAHYNHVHVAYAYGEGNPAFFSNQKDAQSFEDKLIPSNVKSITTNTGELAGLFDGLMGKKPTKLKPGQKPTMNELGTDTGYKMLLRKQQTEEAMKMLKGVSYNPTQQNSPANATNIGDLAGLFDGLMGKKPEKLKPGQKPTMDQLGTGTGYKMLQRIQQTEEAMKMLNGVSYNPPQTNSPINITNTITIQQLPGQDADQLAAIVARKIGEAISDVQSSSIFV